MSAKTSVAPRQIPDVFLTADFLLQRDRQRSSRQVRGPTFKGAAKIHAQRSSLGIIKEHMSRALSKETDNVCCGTLMKLGK